MLKSILSPLTTATSFGVGIRYVTTIVSSVIAVLGILNLLSSDQVESLTKLVPDLAAAIAAVVPIIITIYATLTKSSSDKAAEIAKKVDKQIPAASPVVIKTPGSAPDIVVSGK